MAFATTALARPLWVMAAESTLASAGLGPRACALAAPTSATRASWVGRAPVQEQRRLRRRACRLQSSPGSSPPLPCRRGCRGSWGPACRSTATAAGAAKAVPLGHRKLLYQRVSIHTQVMMDSEPIHPHYTRTLTTDASTNFSNNCCSPSPLLFCIPSCLGHKLISSVIEMSLELRSVRAFKEIISTWLHIDAHKHTVYRMLQLS